MGSPTLSEWLVCKALQRIEIGEVQLKTHDGVVRRFAGDVAGPHAAAEVTEPKAARRVVMEGGVGLATGYINGEWATPDLLECLRCGALNLKRREGGLRLPANPFNFVKHLLRDNDLGGSKRNIAAHYDLGNSFYRLWLDPTMTYSCAFFDGPDDVDLRAAQIRKWDALIAKLELTADDRVLEIGCGWGGFAVHAAKTTGCSVVGLTLSEEQHSFATELVSAEGLADRVEIRMQDYRHVNETYTKVASIEMFEAVGMKWWPTFFEKVAEVLEPGGLAGIQVITIDHDRLAQYARRPDFIQLYIFPGGMLPSPERFVELSHEVGLTPDTPDFHGQDYARTLGLWREGFEEHLDEVRALGFDERFIRMWRYYYCYCQAGFEADTINVMQIRLSKSKEVQ